MLSPLACWYFVLGWAGAKATAVWQRLIVSAVLLACVPGYFGVVERKRVVTAGILIVSRLPALRVPGVRRPAIARTGGLPGPPERLLPRWRIGTGIGSHG
ncbi:hypothetical protein ACGFQG_09745 [Nocardia fluminea]|uniref:hypothetical protein n=1 Tax=Nocardia fluminea TaxID=134984 RepID=UPI0033C3D5F5